MFVRLICGLLFLTILAGCASTTATSPIIPIDNRSANPGETITRSGKPVQLIGTPIRVGSPLPDVTLIDSTMVQRKLSDYRGKVLILSFVPSLDTGVCARQTRDLKAQMPDLLPGIEVLTISRDLPFAQARYAREQQLNDVRLLSDYADARFGRNTGLLIKELMLLARGMMVVDREGIVRYLQVVPEIAHLPDIRRAIAEANKIAAES